LGDRANERRVPVPVPGELPGDQVRNNLGVGFRERDDTFSLQHPAQAEIVADDAVVDDRDFTVIGEMGVSVSECDSAVGRPACVTESDGRVGETGEPPGRQRLCGAPKVFDSEDAVSCAQGEPTRVRAPVFKQSQPLEDAGSRPAPAKVPDYAAHDVFAGEEVVMACTKVREDALEKTFSRTFLRTGEVLRPCLIRMRGLYKAWAATTRLLA
jgi:hypothetical protein